MFESTFVTQYDMLKIPFEDIERNAKTLCIQEADKIFDSRRSMRNENTLLSSLTGQAGKRNLNIYYDTQFWNRIDGALRYVTEFVCSCSSIINSKTKTPLAFEYEMIDMYDMTSKKYIIPATMMEPFYAMYNSYETTTPLTASKSMEDISGIEQEVKPSHHKKKRDKEFEGY